MNLKNYYYYYNKALSKKWCEEIIQLGKSKQANFAKTMDFENSSDCIAKKKQTDRLSDVSWLDEKKIYETLHPFLKDANEKSGWNFQWEESEQIQFTTYNKGCFYDWHMDCIYQEDYKKRKDYKNKQRKLSMTVCLSDENNFTGGDFEFDFRNMRGSHKKICKEIKQQGSIIVFPSFVWHKVHPILSGTRYSLVMWSVGDPWK